ncbi:MAG: hypothetical protein SXV54_14185 [Chloroflexota bacterium]|nr:hypothetical protein [Chloroflexota bacterium]
MRQEHTRLILAVTLSTLTILAGGCRAATPEAYVHTTYDYVTASSIEELVHKANVIVIGRVVSVAEFPDFNLARDTRDHSQPASDITCPATVYEVKVERYLKGDAGPTLQIARAEKILPPEEIKEGVTVHMPDQAIPLMVEARYLFFLVPGERYPDSSLPEYYGFVPVQPTRFRLESGEARVESEWAWAERYFPSTTEEALLQQVMAEVVR